MRILFITSDITIGEPLGILQLSAILKKAKHLTMLLSLKHHSLERTLEEFRPDIIAYSAMTSDLHLFVKADMKIKKLIKKKRILRIMGGAHPTYDQEVLREMSLDAICIGEGDYAISEIAKRFSDNQSFSGIKNVLSEGDNPESIKKILVSDLDDLPFIDRDIYYNAVPVYRSIGMKVFITGRGCPYSCSYCHNHAFKESFGGCGNILRRHSPKYVIDEIKYVLKNYLPIKMVRFADDTFAHTIDDWLIEFTRRYKKEIKLPFYCLMRSNAFTEEMAKLLKSAKCVSVGMAVECGDTATRNDILKRNLTDEQITNSFKYARKYRIRTWGNTLLAIPGTRYEDDFNSFLFTKKLKLDVPTFGIVSLFPKTELAKYAMKLGYLPASYSFNKADINRSPLNNFTQKEKEMQLGLVYLGVIFCKLSDRLIPLLRFLLKIRLVSIYKYIGRAYLVLGMGFWIFPNIYPRTPFKLLKLFRESLRVIK